MLNKTFQINNCTERSTKKIQKQEQEQIENTKFFTLVESGFKVNPQNFYLFFAHKSCEFLPTTLHFHGEKMSFIFILKKISRIFFSSVVLLMMKKQFRRIFVGNGVKNSSINLCFPKQSKEKPNNSNSRVFLTISDIIMLILLKIRRKTGENKVKSLDFSRTTFK